MWPIQGAQVVNEHAFVAGNSLASIDGQSNAGGADVFLLKFDADGNILWTILHGGPGNDWVRSLQVNAAGSVAWVTGLSDSYGLDGQTGAGSYDVFVMKFEDPIKMNLLELEEEEAASRARISERIGAQDNLTSENGVLFNDTAQALHGVVLSTYALQVPRESDQVNVQIENIKVMLPASLINRLTGNSPAAIVVVAIIPKNFTVISFPGGGSDATPQSNFVSISGFDAHGNRPSNEPFEEPVEIQFPANSAAHDWDDCFSNVQKVCASVRPATGEGQRKSQPVRLDTCSMETFLIMGLFSAALEDSRPGNSFLVSWWMDAQWILELRAIFTILVIMILAVMSLCLAVYSDQAFAKEVKKFHQHSETDSVALDPQPSPSRMQSDGVKEGILANLRRRAVEIELGKGFGFLEELDKCEYPATHREKPLRQQERKLAMACGILGLCKLLKLSQHSFCFQLPVGRMHSIRVGWVADLPFAPECAHSAICATSLWGSSSDPGERPTGVFFITVHIISKDHIYKRINEKSNIAEQTFVCHVFGAILGR